MLANATVTVIVDASTYTAVVDADGVGVTVSRDGVLAGRGTLTCTRHGVRIDDCPAVLPDEVFEGLERLLDEC